MEIPKELVLVAVSTAYAAVLSFGWGRKMCEYAIGRVMVTAGGVLITLAVLTLDKPERFWSLFIGFTLAAAPQFLRVVILYIVEQDRAKVARHDVRAANDGQE